MKEYYSSVPPAVEDESGEIVPPDVSIEEYKGISSSSEQQFDGDTYIGEVPIGMGLSEGDKLYLKAARIADKAKERRLRRERSVIDSVGADQLPERPSDDIREIWGRNRNN